MNLLFFILISCGLIGVVEIAKRKFSLSTNVSRRVTHIGAALIATISPLFLNQPIIVIACLFFAGLVLVSRKTTLLSSIHDVERKSFGDVFLPLGEALSAIVFLPHNIAAFQFGVLVMGISDAFAGLGGEKFGKHKVHFLGNAKSLEGSAIFFICTLILALLFTPIFGYQLIMIAATLTIVEFLSIYGLDNLVLPILGAFLFQFLM